jgi:hypothetical protein
MHCIIQPLLQVDIMSFLSTDAFNINNSNNLSVRRRLTIVCDVSDCIQLVFHLDSQVQVVPVIKQSWLQQSAS